MVMDLNSKSSNYSIFNLGAKYFGAHMVHDTSVYQVFLALQGSQKQ